MGLDGRVLAHLRRERLLAAGSAGVVACSGGGDSTALLHLLARLARPLPLTLTVCCVDHGLRGAAAAEAAFVGEVAASLGLRFRLERLDPATLRRPGCSLQAVAREQRYATLERVASEVGAGWIATGHTADDVAETVVMNLLKGSARPLGIAARRGRVVRPLLRFRHAELTAWLAAQGLPWCEDPSNRDPHYLRNRVRHEIVPVLAAVNPALARVLGHTAELLGEEERYLEALLAPHLGAIEPVAGGVEVAVATLVALPLALRRRLVRTACHRIGLVKELGFVHVEQVRALADGEAGAGEVRLPGGRVARRQYDRLYLGGLRPAPPVGEFEVAVVAGRAEIAALGLALELTREGPNRGAGWSATRATPSAALEPIREPSGHRALAAAGRLLDQQLVVRSPRPGDRFRPAGMGGRSKRLAALFIDAKVPAGERGRTPLLVAGGEVVAVGTWRLAEGWAPGPGAERVWVRYTPLAAGGGG
ncbi:MAG: tRNA lysidine(34) synthetase TilS [Nitrospirae bacterium CG18_big_fil_WC_8_21_14_2_50_70_55]|nr:MAG: tRNA lysidine(34) synthetase TilS [Nitrospirae bacterium CG2_30_70_394]PIQ06841.1 MAG: tRNA lysidine(34) synthetase TilS [Nitrospirae bacterium CG18_big_fil_WC_8_21_14_2_50_70_55]PIU79666.1 MAG: tRNA lysidine(34) synthetase TilS [Nitrospirae bacterium CG06_land_8_20_14_3_00_70_43]PIW83725.1 MAG: tRNA lysidine(34) synthetase TilS [Nitrospirae bacterium CG_4_8_14_3_um_filter_70_85]PIX83652.1 MAG: tRNA lysidine(34) synthetase TilS [Nitrospirae bacterium CG_4_10_14_3_um_filter_70_108]HBB40